MTPVQSIEEQRVLVLAPIGQDAELICKTLRTARIQTRICSSAEDLVAQIPAGVGALLVTEESGLFKGSLLEKALESQAPWSDIPIVVLTATGESPRSANAKILAALALGGNIVLLERPLRLLTLTSTVQAALGARRRQYHVRELLKEREDERELLASKVRELAQSNEELEQFAFIAAHDLQEPIRMIGSYLTLVERDKDSFFSERARKYFEFVTNSSSRMKAMIQAVLDYSRIGKEDVENALVDCNQALNQAVDLLSELVQQSEASITAQPLPQIMGSTTQITRLFQNLISNSIKFKSSNPPRIGIKVEKHNNQWIFSITDNGIGIDSKSGKRLFGIFQRLHGSDRYPGTGIGLAACKKIVEQHHGRIWFESIPGTGSTFFFTLAAVDGTGALRRQPAGRTVVSST